jgi:DNA-binding transcriptional ArsR family regulator
MDTAMLAAVASPRRQAILRMVWRDEVSAGVIAAAMPDVTFGAVSQHLRALADAGLVCARADGRQRLYRADRAALAPLAAALEAMWDDALWRLKLAAELEQARRGPRPRRPRAAASRRTAARTTPAPTTAARRRRRA